MDNETKAAVTKALDAAIVSVAEDEFNRLSTGLSDQEIADSIRLTLRSLERLQSGQMPDYDDWDALFYSIWYQPGHVNLAYTLAQLIPSENNPLRTGNGSLEVFDFGCGELAMQFGLALAVADGVEEQGTIPQIAILSEDDSEPMKDIGWRIWRNFVREIAEYPELGILQRICQTMRFEHQADPKATSWLTALHVAYEENAETVKQQLDSLVVEQEPQIVLVTTHEVSEEWAYNPLSHGYSNISHFFSKAEFVLDGEFEEITKFRSDLCNKYIDDMLDFLGTEDYRFVRNYLKSLRTKWVTTDRFETRDFLYRRD